MKDAFLLPYSFRPQNMYIPVSDRVVFALIIMKWYLHTIGGGVEPSVCLVERGVKEPLGRTALTSAILLPC